MSPMQQLQKFWIGFDITHTEKPVMIEFDQKAANFQDARIVEDVRAVTTAARQQLETKSSPGSSWPLFFSNEPPNFTYYLNSSIFLP